MESELSCLNCNKVRKTRGNTMHKQQLVFLFGLFVLPLEAQTNGVLPPVPSDAVEISPSVIPPRQSDPVLLQSQTTGPMGRNLYRWSIAAVLAGNVADAATGWRAQEANPVVAGTGNQFGLLSVAIKSGFVGTSLLIQHIVLRHRPDLYKRMAWMNLITSGALGGVACYNARVN
jgi:hypothetical protein